jgi:hypothetical protein
LQLCTPEASSNVPNIPNKRLEPLVSPLTILALNSGGLLY